MENVREPINFELADTSERFQLHGIRLQMERQWQEILQ